MKKRSISTGSLNFRITASAAVGLLFSFLVLDAVILAMMLPEDPAWIAYKAEGIYSSSGFFALIKNAASARFFMVLYFTEAVLLLLKILFGSRSVKHKLEPVANLSRMAGKLSGSDAFNEEKLRSLSVAIDHIRPASGDEVLRTGDKELAGLEGAVNDLIERMRESYAQQARFVSDASHELRTPIAVIKGYADMLDRWGKTDETVLFESVEAIRTESNRMSYLVEQLLFLARGDSGKTQLKPESCDLFDMMQEVFEESKMIDKDHVYEFRANGPIPACGDLSLLKQTARILVDNAAKYTPAGETILLCAKKEASAVCFSVEDGGIGIAGNALPYLFDRFYRADNSRARDSGGTGLGLAIAKWIVDRHGGSFDIVSREGFGTRITVRIPAFRMTDH